MAVDKSVEVMNIELRRTAIDPNTFEADLKDMEGAIDSNTIAIIASAPQYQQGIMDPIEAISRLSLKHGVPFHVDACLGGFLLAFTDPGEFGPFDFRVAGVTSISADTHKFGYGPKGTSVLLFRSKEYRRHQYFIHAEWSGGYGNFPTFAGSRSGATICGTWAAMIRLGLDGYRELTRSVIDKLAFITNE